MKSFVMKSHERRAPRWMIAGLLLLVAGALATLAVVLRLPGKPAARELSRIEREASARFAGSRPYVTLPDGRRLSPATAAHALQMKVKAFQAILARESEQRDPTFHLKAEAELDRRRPMLAAIEWTDITGNREMSFTIEDSSSCGLDGKTELTLAAEDVAPHPCLTQGGMFWEGGTQLTVHLTPVARTAPLWAELVYATKRAMATRAHLASSETPKDL
jgi:hypothetical protein